MPVTALIGLLSITIYANTGCAIKFEAELTGKHLTLLSLIIGGNIMINSFFEHYNGIFINLFVMLACTYTGKSLKKHFIMTKEFTNILYTGIALACLLVGISGIKIDDPIACVAALLIGPVIGYYLKLETHINHLINNMANRFFNCSNTEDFREPFVSYLMLTLIGTLSINGPLENVVHGNVSLMLIKSSLDGLVAFIFAMTYREHRSIYVSTFIVFIFECIISIIVTFASVTSTVLYSLNNIATVGSVLMIILGLNIMKVCNIETITFLPAILIPILFSL